MNDLKHSSMPVNPTELFRHHYREHVERLRKRKPSLANLCRFLSAPESAQEPCRIVALDFFEGKDTPETFEVSFDSLPPMLIDHDSDKLGEHTFAKDSVIENDELQRHGALQGRVLIVEDLDKKTINLLGSTLDIDPLFFAGHLQRPLQTLQAQAPDQCVLPSQLKQQSFINLHYHRALVLQGGAPPVDILRRHMNIDRKVVVTPLSADQYVGIAQHCTSVLLIERHAYWLCIILVDRPIDRVCYCTADEGGQLRSYRLAFELFLGGYEDFLDSLSITRRAADKFSFPDRYGLLADLLFYWSLHTPGHFDPSSPTLHSLAYFPLRIVAAEWMKYIGIMYRAVKQFEYSTSTTDARDELSKLDSDMRALQRWRRRSMSSEHKLRAVIRMLKTDNHIDMPNNESLSLIEDYEHIADSVENFGRRLESMLPVVTSLVQIIDSRRSVDETANVSRLTIMALVFVPLTYISSLFSMSERLGPGGPLFWVYFAVALPVTLGVVVIAKPPFSMLSEAIRRGVWTRRSTQSAPVLQTRV